MRFICRLTVLILGVILMFTVTPQADTAGDFDALCEDILASLQSFYPVRATEMGIHSHDFLLADFSSGSVKKMISRLRDYEKKLRRYEDADLDHPRRVNHRLIKSNVDIALQDLRHIKWHEKSPVLYVDQAINGVYFLLLSQHAPLNEKRPAILARMKAVPKLFETARRNLDDIPPIWIEAALESLESGSAFYQQVAGELMSEFPDHADEILRVSTAAREAMNDFAGWLGQADVGEDDGFAVGEEDFNYKLSHQYLLDIDADSMLTIGRTLLTEAQEEYRKYAAYVESEHQTGADSVFVPVCVGAEDILDYYNWETEQMRLWCEESGYVTVPPEIADVSVVETPPFLQSMISSIAYQPAGPFDSVQHGYFYVRPLPEEMDRRQIEARWRYVHRRGFKGSVVHEAYPGHHLQLQLAGLNPDPVRKWQFNLMLIEGWALYCEEAVYKHGLYGEEDPARWLSVLGGIRFRAARIVADVMLHTGQLSFQECVDWMIEALEVESASGKDYIRKEVRRYTLEPTVPMSYLMGKRAVLKLRAAVSARDGEDFSLQAFHDALLAEGSIPPALFWDIWRL